MTRTIQAQVSKGILNVANRLFDASLTDILSETLQNARRAGATQIQCWTQDIDGQTYLIIHDDGKGIDDPSVLLNLGYSKWDAQTKELEDPAGMGVFSLGSRGALIQSRDWVIQLKPEHFNGTPVEVFDNQEPIQGVRVGVPLKPTEASDLVRTTYGQGLLEKSCFFYPLPVFFQGKELKRTDFLTHNNCAYYQWYKGIKIGITRNSGYATKALNFHGVVINKLPKCPSVREDSDTYTPIFDVVGSADLKLVLPARKEVYQNDFYMELLQAGLQTLYRFFAEHKTEHHLTYAVYKQIKDAGVDLQEAVPELFTLSPKTAASSSYGDNYYIDDENPEEKLHLADIDRPPAVVFFDAQDDLHFKVAVYNAFKDTHQLLQPEFCYEGYTWYDQYVQHYGYKLNNIIITQDGEEYDIDAYDGDEDVDRIQVELKHSATGKVIRGDLNVYIAGSSDYPSIWEGVPIYIKKSFKDEYSVGELIGDLKDLLYCPSDDGDTYDTQENEFDEEAENVASKRLLSAAEALIRKTTEKVRHLMYCVPKGKTLVIKLASNPRTCLVELQDQETKND